MIGNCCCMQGVVRVFHGQSTPAPKCDPSEKQESSSCLSNLSNNLCTGWWLTNKANIGGLWSLEGRLVDQQCHCMSVCSSFPAFGYSLLVGWEESWCWASLSDRPPAAWPAAPRTANSLKDQRALRSPTFLSPSQMVRKVWKYLYFKYWVCDSLKILANPITPYLKFSSFQFSAFWPPAPRGHTVPSCRWEPTDALSSCPPARDHGFEWLLNGTWGRWPADKVREGERKRGDWRWQLVDGVGEKKKTYLDNKT